MMRPAVFLDRDGTLNEEVEYLSSPDGLVLIPGAGEAVRRINLAGMAAVVITNQSGIARGYFDEAVLSSIHARLQEELKKENAFLDGIYVCPHHAEGVVEEYSKQCLCRKPGAGLLQQAVRELSLELPASYMVGDRFKDIQLAVKIGMRSVLVLTGHGRNEWDQTAPSDRSMPDHVAEDIAAAVDWILADRELGEENK